MILFFFLQYSSLQVDIIGAGAVSSSVWTCFNTSSFCKKQYSSLHLQGALTMVRWVAAAFIDNLTDSWGAIVTDRRILDQHIFSLFSFTLIVRDEKSCLRIYLASQSPQQFFLLGWKRGLYFCIFSTLFGVKFDRLLTTGRCCWQLWYYCDKGRVLLVGIANIQMSWRRILRFWAATNL